MTRSCCLFVVLWILNQAGIAQEYQIAHCYKGCPEGGNAENHLIIRPIYALSYNTERKSADWVAYKVSAGSIGIASSLSRRPVADAYVKDTLEEVDFLDLEDSNLALARYVPLVSFAGSPYWSDTNYLTNVVARSSQLSQGAWYGLDWAIRNLVNRVGEVYIFTGPVYRLAASSLQLNTDKQHRVPDAFFKIVLTEKGEGAAFLLDQDTPVHVHHCNLTTTVDDIEEQTGLQFPLAGISINTGLYSSLGCN